MYEDIREHPDAGLIHAWLDDALSSDDAARMAEHVAACPQCTELVAEARGLIAGASRIVTELDEAPVPTVRMQNDIPRSSVWRTLRLTPARLSAAAVLIVALGVRLTQRQMPTRESATVDSIAVKSAPVQRPIGSVPREAAPRQSDAETRNQVGQRIAAEQPVRTVEPSASSSIAIPPAAAPAPTSPNVGASEQVAAARMSIAAQRDTTSARADHAKVADAPAAGAASPVAVAARAADARAERSRMSVNAEGAVSGAASQARRIPLAGCYLVESTSEGSGMWGDAKLPFVIAFDSTGTTARVLTPAGGDTQGRAVVSRSGTDSLTFTLRRIGFTGLMSLGRASGQMNGFAKSAGSSVMERTMQVRARPERCPSP